MQQIETLRTENDTLRQRVETSGIVPIGSIKNSVKFIVTEVRGAITIMYLVGAELLLYVCCSLLLAALKQDPTG